MYYLHEAYKLNALLSGRIFRCHCPVRVSVPILHVGFALNLVLEGLS
jgi:hypothetical protein